ncbi:MAG: hypothetical protein ACC707_07840 [Thiohalomonadales bacterium]
MLEKITKWFDRNIIELGRELRISYLPPLMVYMAAGISGLTAIVGTFFVKDYLGLSAEFLAALGFWAGIPWALKMPLGHIVDLIWRYKFLMVLLGASLIAASLLIMIGLLVDRNGMQVLMSVEAWYVVSVLLAPIGYVVQDVVADAMTVEAVPRYDDKGQPLSRRVSKRMHTTMQTLGRVAIISGGIAVALLNIYMFNDVGAMDDVQKHATYIQIYKMALFIPLVSILGIALAAWLSFQNYRRLRKRGYQHKQAWELLQTQEERPPANWWILGGSLVFVIFTLTIGLSDVPFAQEIIFVGSLAIVVFLMYRLLLVLKPEARNTLIGTAIIIFVYRAIPSTGSGATWWMLDELKFDQQFLSVLSLIAGVLTLFGVFVFRRFMAEKSIAYIIVALTIASTVLSLPIIGMFYGLHEVTAAYTGGVVDARFIALVDTALESPLGQIAMIPMLAWIANSAPSALKATFFAVLASFTNLALSLSQLGTKYINQIYTINREVKDLSSGEIQVAADYSELGFLFITVTTVGLIIPIIAVLVMRRTRFTSA